MKNNPLNGYQPDHDEEIAANAAHSAPKRTRQTLTPIRAKLSQVRTRRQIQTKKPPRPAFYPTCRYCGKQSLPDAPYESQEVANEAATMRCDCFDARQYQDEVEKKKRREANIKKLRQRLCDFSDYTAGRNMELSDDLYNFLLNVGINVLDANIAGATIKVGRFTVKFSVGNKSALSIAFTYSDGAKLEV